uniref:Uncharacterized protein n=1 Tax=Melopsittacus undulatus TaxID=13146 RepID=A0A8V5GEL3_MELUD
MSHDFLCENTVFPFVLLIVELGSNRKYLNCLSQHLRSTQETTIPHFQLKPKPVSVPFFSCLLFYLVSLWIFLKSFWENMFLKPQVFKHKSCIMFYLYL